MLMPSAQGFSHERDLHAKKGREFMHHDDAPDATPATPTVAVGGATTSSIGSASKGARAQGEAIKRQVREQFGRTALSGSRDGTLRLWDLARGDEVARFVADAGLMCWAFSSSGTQVIAGDASGAVHFHTVVGVESPSARPVLVAQAGPRMAAAPATMAPQTRGREVAHEPQTPGDRAADRVSGRRWWPFGQRGMLQQCGYSV
jgi:hypothetical protein